MDDAALADREHRGPGVEAKHSEREKEGAGKRLIQYPKRHGAGSQELSRSRQAAEARRLRDSLEARRPALRDHRTRREARARDEPPPGPALPERHRRQDPGPDQSP